MTKQIQIDLAKAAIINLVPKQKNKRDELVEFALKQVGITEFPAGSNKIIYNTWFYGREVQNGDRKGAKYPWCCTLFSWLFNEIGKKFPIADYNNGWSSVPNLYKYAVKHGMITTEPMAGDLIIYFWAGEIKHIGMYLSKGTDEKHVKSFEGNTSFDEKGSQDNGGCCAIKNQNKKLVKAYVNIDKFLK